MLKNKDLIYVDMQCPVSLKNILNSFDQNVMSKLIVKLLNYSLKEIVDKEDVIVIRKGDSLYADCSNNYNDSLIAYRKVYIKKPRKKYHICFSMDKNTAFMLNKLKVYKDGKNNIITFRDLDLEIEKNTKTMNKIYITLLSSCFLFKEDLFDKRILS